MAVGLGFGLNFWFFRDGFETLLDPSPLIFLCLRRLGVDVNPQRRNDLNVTFAVCCISISFEYNMDVTYK